MKIIYICDFCGEEYYDREACLEHEKEHYRTEDIETVIRIYCRNNQKDLCEFCKNIYYSYGVEANCGRKEKDCFWVDRYPKFEVDLESAKVKKVLERGNNNG